MQYVCKTIRFNFEPTLRSNKICLYVRHLKRGRKKIKLFNSLVPAKLWHLFSLFFIPLLRTLNPRKTEFLKTHFSCLLFMLKLSALNLRKHKLRKWWLHTFISFPLIRWTLLLSDFSFRSQAIRKTSCQYYNCELRPVHTKRIVRVWE